jgi:hypothetical protein
MIFCCSNNLNNNQENIDFYSKIFYFFRKELNFGIQDFELINSFIFYYDYNKDIKNNDNKIGILNKIYVNLHQDTNNTNDFKSRFNIGFIIKQNNNTINNDLIINNVKDSIGFYILINTQTFHFYVNSNEMPIIKKSMPKWKFLRLDSLMNQNLQDNIGIQLKFHKYCLLLCSLMQDSQKAEEKDNLNNTTMNLDLHLILRWFWVNFNNYKKNTSASFVFGDKLLLSYKWDFNDEKNKEDKHKVYINTIFYNDKINKITIGMYIKLKINDLDNSCIKIFIKLKKTIILIGISADGTFYLFIWLNTKNFITNNENISVKFVDKTPIILTPVNISQSNVVKIL